jgi:RHS repeat-associated protein
MLSNEHSRVLVVHGALCKRIISQDQIFDYGDLNRLVSAVASGGTGGTYSLKNYAYNPDTGNLSSNAGVSYTYGDSAHKHAVTSTSNGNSYGYDANGNQTTRTVGGITYTLIYDAESRLVQIKRGTDVQATYYYDGDGNRIRTEVGSTFTTYIGSHLEWECIDSTCAMKKYYSAAGQRVALRKGDGTLYFLLTDHLGNTAITATSSGGRYAELRYYPWGGTRYTYGTTPTSYRYTGQREAEVGLYYYGARFYDPQLGRFVSSDTIIPQQQGSQAWDRYAGMNNNPLRYTDPSGHYGKDVHYDLTYQITHDIAMNIADEEGWALEEIRAFADYMALTIATGDMAADAKNPDGSFNVEHISNNPITPPIRIEDPVSGEVWFQSRAPHWYTTPEAESALSSADNPFDFGIAMHMYQDSHSHWQKLGQPDTPIGIWFGHFLDLPNKGTSQSVDNFDPLNNSIDAAMMEGMTTPIETFVISQICNWK